MKSLLHLLNLQIIFSIFIVDGAKLIPLFNKKNVREKRSYHWLQMEHMPDWFKPLLDSHVNGTEMPDPLITPDYRVLEPPFLARHEYHRKVYYEFERPLRISPHKKMTDRWNGQTRWFHSNNDEVPSKLGCYCTTVYRMTTMLAGCAVLTIRHVLTTASSTDLILNKHRKAKNLYTILGLWYDISDNLFNSSMYIYPCRIHHHPKYERPHTVNISHPIPCGFDLSLWTTVHNLRKNACTCSRGASHWLEYQSTTPRWPDIAHIVGFQYVKAYRKVPMPWFKYAVRTKKHIVPCPKTEWGWFHCMLGSWAKFGVESGAAWHRALENRYWLYDGLIGMAAFSMHLRSEEITHYFTVINTHPVLDFIYDSYMGTLPYEYLDSRFENTKWRVPQPWYNLRGTIPILHDIGTQGYEGHELPWYKKK